MSKRRETIQTARENVAEAEKAETSSLRAGTSARMAASAELRVLTVWSAVGLIILLPVTLVDETLVLVMTKLTQPKGRRPS